MKVGPNSHENLCAVGKALGSLHITYDGVRRLVEQTVFGAAIPLINYPYEVRHNLIERIMVRYRDEDLRVRVLEHMAGVNCELDMLRTAHFILTVIFWDEMTRLIGIQVDLPPASG